MRRMLVSRSSFEKPRPLLRFVRTSSPSSTSILTPRARSCGTSSLVSVVLPAPDNPVNHNVNPCDTNLPLLSLSDFYHSIAPGQRVKTAKREYGKDGNNGTNGKGSEITGEFPFVPLFPSFPYSLCILNSHNSVAIALSLLIQNSEGGGRNRTGE